MQQPVRNLNRAIWNCALTLVVLGACALGANGARGQTTNNGTAPRSVLGRGPVNPLRSGGQSEILTVQATEPVPSNLPSPLRIAPQPKTGGPAAMQPGGMPLSPIPEEAQPLSGEQQEIISQQEANGWPADAPAQEHYYGPERHGRHPFQHQGGHGEPRDPWFAHDDPNDSGRHTGWGEPLIGTSWRNRPWYWGVFLGGMLNDDLVSGHVEQANAPFLGLRLGNDFDHFWGWEGRYAFTRTELFDGRGAPIAEDGRNYYVDVALLHYPWGDSRWRPYIMAGVGFSNHRFENDTGVAIDDSSLTLPFGVGLKHYYSPWFTMRFDIVDNWTLGSGQIDSMHNFSFMVGAEFRFGGNRPNYFPWHGNTVFW